VRVAYHPPIFLGAFAQFREATVSFVMSVRPSVRMQQIGSNWMDFHKIWYFKYFFQNLSKKIKFHSIQTRITGALHGGRYTFLIISRSILLKMRNVSDKSCREYQDTHFVFSNIFSKILQFVR